MKERPIHRFRPGLESLEAKRPLSAGATAHLVTSEAGSGTPATPAESSAAPAASEDGQSATANATVSAKATEKKPNFGYLLYRITNPTPYNNKLTPPFTQVYVASKQPVPGQTYNVLFVSVRNGTAKTFDASSDFMVRLPNGDGAFPILTGDQQWKPGQVFVFYILSKKYYPLPSQVHSGFEFDLGGARSVAIPGPSGIFLRVKYNPATFAKTLNWIVAFGPGNQGGKGAKFGLPNTSINEFVSAKTNRNDFGGYF